MNPTSWNEASPFHLYVSLNKTVSIKAGGRICKIQKKFLDMVSSQRVGSSNTEVLVWPCLLVLITDVQSRHHGKSESDSYYLFDYVVNSFTGPNRYPVDTSLIHIESRKSPTAVLFDDDTGRISIRHCEY
ncbi:hypothetical protein Tco_1060852 [Tanacetum coccineum]